MKKTLALSAVLIGLLFSCKKSNSDSSGSYHITANIDGTAKTFNSSALAVKITSSGFTSLGVGGGASPTTTASDVVLINISNIPGGKPIVAGTYTDTSSSFTISCTYTLNPTSIYMGSTDVTGTGLPYSAIKNHVKVVISSIDATSVKGTFSGDLYNNGDITGAKKTFTSGDFYVKLQ